MRMYRKRNREQVYIEDFVLPFGGKLRADNRWVKLAGMMPWDFIEDIYAESMCEDNGAPAISARIAFGALYIKENENLVDERTVEYIAENPYMQYFLGLREYRDEPLFDVSMMVHFRKRFPADKVEEINKRIFVKRSKDDTDHPDGTGGTGETKENAGDTGKTVANKGELVLDATCAPADIRYPSDLSLLNEARENLETIIEELWEHSPRQGHKTRYSRKKARSQYLHMAKQRKPSARRMRTAISKQLRYVRSGLETVGELLLHTGPDVLPEKRLDRILVICELCRQQYAMYHDRSHQCEDRIVSLRQPHIRPIVRGKAGKRYEFGQKLALSVVDGYTFIEKQSYDNFHEGISLIESVERYNLLHGCYPVAVQADTVYRNRENLAYCKIHGIRLSGPKLGRPSKNVLRDRETERQDLRKRQIVEGRNGIAKRRFGLDLIYATLPETALTEAALQILCMNVRIRLFLLRWRLLFFGRHSALSTGWLFQKALVKASGDEENIVKQKSLVRHCE